MAKYVLGLDFGTDSVRTVVVNAESGKEEANQVVYYKRWSQGLYCDPAKNQFRQHPLDYIEGLEEAVKGALSKLGSDSGGNTSANGNDVIAIGNDVIAIGNDVIAIGIDTTGSTPCLVDRDGSPLALKEQFKDNPNAMFVLWKDHTAVGEAGEINDVARSWGGSDFTQFEGEIYSSEWFWAELLHVLRDDDAVRKDAFSFVEHCDWMPALLTGRTGPLELKRSRCAAGHKAMWHASWNGLPDDEFLAKVDPLLKGWRERLYSETFTSDVSVGNLTDEWAKRLGLTTNVAVAVGAFDAHMGAVGGGITAGALTKIMGTSTCDMLVAPEKVVGDKQVAGICGQVDGSIVPGLVGLEAGQSGFGDVFAWFAGLLEWPLDAVETGSTDKQTSQKLKEEIKKKILARLDQEADEIPLEETGLLALDWLNGRRTPDADQNLKGAIIGLTLGSTAPKIYRALVESTAFGSRATMDRFIGEGVKIDEVVAVGGITKNSPFVMQLTADVMNQPIKVATSEQTCALGAAMFGAVAAGLYADVQTAQKHMGSGFSETYTPDPKRAAKYDGIYEKYLGLGKLLEDELRELYNLDDTYKADRRMNKVQRLSKLREEVYETNMEIVRTGLVVHTFGNASGIDRESGTVIIKPSGVAYQDLSPENMVGVDLDYNVVEGDLNPSSDTKTHVMLYRAFEEIGGIVHTHSKYATAWAQAKRSLDCLGTTHADYFYGEVPCTDVIRDSQIARDYEEETAVQIIETFKAHDYREIGAVLVASHGPFTWGKNPTEAAASGFILEYIAELNFLSHTINPEVKAIKQALLDKHFLRKHGSGAYYGQKHRSKEN